MDYLGHGGKLKGLIGKGTVVIWDMRRKTSMVKVGVHRTQIHLITSIIHGKFC